MAQVNPYIKNMIQVIICLVLFYSLSIHKTVRLLYAETEKCAQSEWNQQKSRRKEGRL